KGCSATANLLENTPGYAANDYDLYGKVKLEFDKLNYGSYSGAPYTFNPWVQFIHGDAILPDQLGMPGVYAYSVDDAVGNLNVEAQGYIVDIGSTKHLENQTRARPARLRNRRLRLFLARSPAHRPPESDPSCGDESGDGVPHQRPHDPQHGKIARSARRKIRRTATG